MTRFWDGRTDGRTDGWSDPTPRPAFAFGEAGKNKKYILTLSSRCDYTKPYPEITEDLIAVSEELR